MNGIAATATWIGTVALAVFAGSAAQEKMTPGQKKEPVFASSADDAKYKEVVSGVSKAVIWGDPDKGAYGAFTKFVPGQTNALHTHSNDIRMVVLKGAYVYKPETGDEQRVGAGQFLLVPAGARHVSMGDTKDGATFYEESNGKFELVSVEPKK